MIMKSATGTMSNAISTYSVPRIAGSATKGKDEALVTTRLTVNSATELNSPITKAATKSSKYSRRFD